MKKLGLKQKIWLSIILFSFVMVVTVGGLTKFLYEKFYIDKQIETIMARGRSLEKSFYSETEEEFLEKVAWANEYLDCEVIFSDNPMLLSGAAPFEMDVAQNLISFEERQVLLNGDVLVMIRDHERFNQKILAIVVPLFENDRLAAALFLYRPLSSIYEPFQPITAILISISLLLIVLLVVVAKKTTSYVVKPLEHMMNVTKQIGDGDFTKRVYIQQEDELGELAKSFNVMTEKLAAEENKRKQFLANVSHELRTPISYMKNYTEALEEGIIGYDQYAAVMKKESERLERLVSDLLDLAQLEGESYPMNKTVLPFAQLIEDMTERFVLDANKKMITIRKDLDEDVIVYGDEDRLSQVYSNVMTNALKYTNEQGTIHILLTKDEKWAILTVEDSGIGIAKEHLPHLTERFYRVDKSRARKEGGTGLGLAIASQIVRKHDGLLKIESEVGKGTKVTVRLPLYHA